MTINIDECHKQSNSLKAVDDGVEASLVLKDIL